MNKFFNHINIRNIGFMITIQVIILIFPVPTFGQSPYDLNWNKDGLVLLIGFPLAIGAYSLDASIKPLTLEEINNLNRNDIPKLDRFASYNYSRSASNLSDILLYTCLATPLLLLTSSAIRSDYGLVYGMYAESMLFGIALPFYGKGGVQRIRPYTYKTETPMEIKMTAEAKKSFFSGHSSGAFTSTIFLSTVYCSYYPNSRWKPYIWTGSVLLASSIGYLRIAAGAHFLTDVLVGAIVGSAIGYLIPKIHETNTPNSEYMVPNNFPPASLISFQFAL